ncbi:MAG: exo-alpha-sialidase, partial [Fuerstia sp.]|nr:exo-alpha-sialidase [Fuerstiella sp.]
TVIASGHGPLTPKQPQAAISADGSVHVVFGVGDAVQYARSANGRTFEKPKTAFRVPNIPLGMRRGPRVAIAKDVIVVTAIGGKVGKGRDGDVLSWRSADDGTTWQGPVRVNDTADSAREGLHAMASGEDGSIWCVWLDLRDKKSEVYAARSIDGGSTWGSNVCVYRSPDGSVCECCHPSVAVGKDGVHVMFRNSLDGNRDMYITSSADAGKSFTPATKLGHGTWSLDACPMDGGMLASAPAGSVQTVWRRDGNVYTARATDDPEEDLGNGQQPWIAATEQGSFIVWTSGREGDLMLRQPGSKVPKTLAHDARDPMLVASANGKGTIICCWEAKNGPNTEVVVQRIDTAK